MQKYRYSQLNIKQLHLPTCDHFEPSLDYLVEAVNFISQHKKNGSKVYVHCKAGHGRAAAVALCWLMHENPDRSAQELNELLRMKRKVRATLYKQQNIKLFHEKLHLNSKKSSN